MLTALGIVFGVAAVIAMLAIGSGAKKAILDQLKMIGTNNIVITSIKADQDDEQEQESEQDKTEKKKFSPGLNLRDLNAIQDILPHVKFISPELLLKTSFMYKDVHVSGHCVGVWNDYFEIYNVPLEEGNRFSNEQMINASPVCIVGRNIKTRMFKNSSPIGERIKCGNQWLTIIGVLSDRPGGTAQASELGVRDFNQDIYIPVQSAIKRYEDRNRIDRRDISRGRRGGNQRNYHQIDRAIIHIDDNNFLKSSASVMTRMLKRRHNDREDIKIHIPELLIKQQQKTQETLNFVLAIIAGISLLVGGIGIMNIMLASVLERIKEIGLRRSIGARRVDIVLQFLLESTLISLMGGIIGIVLGVATAKIIASYSDITTEISAFSIILSFGVAVSVGILFGYLPSQKAAKLDPVKALRSD